MERKPKRGGALMSAGAGQHQDLIYPVLLSPPPHNAYWHAIMSASQDPPRNDHTLRAKRRPSSSQTSHPPPQLTNLGHSGPTTFFLKSERDMSFDQPASSSTASQSHKTDSAPRRGSSNAASTSTESTSTDPTASTPDFGVQSLASTVSPTLSPLPSKRPSPRNPVHPKIAATGARILSDSYYAAQTPPSPLSLRQRSPASLGRRGSIGSSIALSATPEESGSPERTGRRNVSVKSLLGLGSEDERGSDESSQAVASSSEDDVDDESEGDHNLKEASRGDKSMPQLVMPSLPLPTRRPFTRRGRGMGRSRIMVVGAKGVGKTSLIRSLCRVCEDVVHLDPVGSKDGDEATQGIAEIGASTRPFPPWWTDIDLRRALHRRKSFSDGVLERNLTFIDTPGFKGGRNVDLVSKYFADSLAHAADVDGMAESELVALLGGDGGLQIDVVLYIFDSHLTTEGTVEPVEADLLRSFCKWTTIVPVIGRADAVKPDELAARKKQINQIFRQLDLPSPISPAVANAAANEIDPREPFAISSALGDDPETIDASILMASSYLQPLVPSELTAFADAFLDPDNLARLRHISASKYVLWRHQSRPSDLHSQSPNPHRRTAPFTTTNNPTSPTSPSQVLVPHSTSSYYHSSSSPTSSSSPFPLSPTASYNPLDLSLSRSRPHTHHPRSPANPTTTTSPSRPRPQKGHLGGPPSILDPRDPLGFLSLSALVQRRGWWVLRVASGLGLTGAVVWWVVGRWEGWTGLLGQWIGGWGGNGAGAAGPAGAVGVERIVRVGGSGEVWGVGGTGVLVDGRGGGEGWGW